MGATKAKSEFEASENIQRKEEQVSRPVLYIDYHFPQVAELTRSWTGKWFELHKIAKVNLWCVSECNCFNLMGFI